ncbi:heterokaryon incompatibility protein-domain-containing protein [Phaeosphaeria sp. MPI-PUGE-AT-0046c]|nr:heterokaryon incompatibility protein-domain-containing protein [Phaeosphaeria sp. MPI-PUGE-AT-0046c]
MAVLEYLPLVKPNEFRLINIQHGPFDAALTLDIFHSTLQHETSVAFDALSYVWGSPDSPQSIKVEIASSDGTIRAFDVSVTHNLATALRHLRRPDAGRIIWADAICINQSDYDERAQQVLMMGDIYRSAKNVVAFLGPAVDDSSIAMNMINNISCSVEVDFGSGLVKPSTGPNADPSWANMHKPLRIERDCLLALYHLIHREWFERLWIRQEIGLGGSRAILLCGHDSIEWSSFCRAIFVLHRRPLEDSGVLDREGLDSLRDRLGVADTVALYSNRAFRFTNLRRQIGRSKCTDQRDRIYGVLGQLRGATQLSIVPDYNKTVAEVYVDATKKNIRILGDLSVLCQCELRDTATSDDEPFHLPSWVPDWSRPLFSAAIHEAQPPFFNQLPALESMNDSTLRAYGLRCATVLHVARAFGSSLEFADDTTTAERVREALLSLKDHVVTADDFAHAIQAFCRCLWLNNFNTRWLPAVPHEAPFEESLSLTRTLLDASNPISRAISLPEAGRCLEKLRTACRDRALFVTDNGHLGMAPECVTTNNEVCILFGTWKPVVLRPVSQTQYRVVGGDCYIHGLMNAEPILGPLPRNLHGLLDAHAVGGLKSAGFMETDLGRIVDVDMRVERFLGDLVENGVLEQPSMRELETQGVKETFMKAKIKIEIFDLV